MQFLVKPPAMAPARPGPDFIYVLQEHLALQAIAASGQRFLDIGCGMGRVLSNAAAATPCASGLDVDADRVEACRRTCPGAQVMQGSADDLPFQSRSMDAVTIYSTLCVVADPTKCIGEIVRVLRPGGLAVINVHGANNPNVRFWSNYYRSRGEIFNSYSLAGARAMLGGAGLQELNVFGTGLTDARKYLPWLRNYGALEGLCHSGAAPDLDYWLSNLPGLFRLASQWFFVVRKA